MIERVAMAIHLSYRADNVTLMSWGRIDKRRRAQAMNAARAAVAAMREPTEAMEIRGGAVDWDEHLTIGGINATLVWRHMIDDALREDI